MDPKYAFEAGSKSSAYLSAINRGVNHQAALKGGRSGKIMVSKKYRPIIHTANNGQSCQRRMVEGFYP